MPLVECQLREKDETEINTMFIFYQQYIQLLLYVCLASIVVPVCNVLYSIDVRVLIGSPLSESSFLSNRYFVCCLKFSCTCI